MAMKGSFIRAVAAISVAGMVVPGVAAAYLEPGMAALLWQVILAGIVGAVFYFGRLKMWINNLGRLIFGSRPKKGTAVIEKSTEVKNHESNRDEV